MEEDIFMKYNDKSKLSNQFIKTTLYDLLEKLPKQILKEAMEKACEKIKSDPQNQIKYFCGICWNIIKNR